MLVEQLDQWWDMSDPAGSRERFEAALAGSEGDAALVLRTQVARTFGLSGDFDRARETLSAMRDEVDAADPEVRARFWLEWGRCAASAAHDPAAITDAARAEADCSYTRAAEAAHEGGLDGLEVDALHMLAFIPTEAGERIRRGRVALALALSSDQPEARRWEAGLRNNLGYELATAGVHDAAAVELGQALALTRDGGDDEAVRIAEWMVAWNARLAGDLDTALGIQRRLEAEWEAAGSSDPYVWSELAAIHDARGDAETAERYRRLTS
ncbi:hypothetical protein [uncultured Phycicoccus sp.]|uniref:hypothetical protein n=1 Tax=uncultured Phycicoccus sp. TaxID=661422 RepID=UPI0026205AEA|nr:hypothetical protein [uncultured Phycicoccus sp.]